jgi:hypothetical protein
LISLVELLFFVANATFAAWLLNKRPRQIRRRPPHKRCVPTVQSPIPRGTFTEGPHNTPFFPSISLSTNQPIIYSTPRAMALQVLSSSVTWEFSLESWKKSQDIADIPVIHNMAARWLEGYLRDKAAAELER